MNNIEKFKQSVRWDHWAQGKVPLFCMIIFYLILKQSLYSAQTIIQFIIFLIFISLVSIYGYLINDLFDMEIDRKQGKKNVFEKVGKLRGSLIVFLIFSIGAMFGSYFLSKAYFPYFLIVIFFFATFYSAPPIRFKERGITGLFVAFCTQYPIPVILVFSVFGSFGTIDMWIFILFAAVTGATLEIGHQRYDLQRDSSTETKTFAVRQGHSKIDRIYKVFVYLDMIAIMGMLITMYFELRLVDIFGQLNVMLPLLLIYMFLGLMVVMKIIKEKKTVEDPYYVEGRNDIINITYTLFPNFFLPFYLACVAFVNYNLFFVFIAIFMLFTFVNFPKANILQQISLVYNALRTSISKG